MTIRVLARAAQLTDSVGLNTKARSLKPSPVQGRAVVSTKGGVAELV